ncbi:MAG TPA: type II secretion system F family protein [Kofleriaceae bacterium]|nr:type II secretion system F family protein [Kofleriaceae bacterium]
MAKFQWEASGRGGETKRGVMEAADETAVANRLRAEQLSPRKIKKQSAALQITIGSGVSSKELQIFTRQLATMIDAGLPLVQCLDILANQTENKIFANHLYQIKSTVEQGSTFSDALRKHPKIFDDLYVNLVAAGEVGGILDTILNRLATYIEKNVKLKGAVKSALVYPIGVLCVAIGVIAVMMLKVIPTFENMYKEFQGAKLPGPTKFVINLSHGFINKWYLFAGGLMAIIGLVMLGLRTNRGREVLDRVLLRVPIIGGVLRKIVVARFTRTLGTLLASGVPILDALDICAKTSGNREVARAIMHARTRISEGQDMAGPLGDTRVFPTMVTQMIGVGEQTGAMDQMLQKIADFYEDEVDTAVSAMTSLIEPVMMAFLGVVVGGLIIAMYLPVFDLASNVDST